MVEVRFADTLTNLRNGETRNGAEPWPLTSLRSNLNCLFATTQRILRKCSTSSGVRDSSSYIRTTTHAAIGPRCHITDSFDTMPSNSGETAQANLRRRIRSANYTHTRQQHTPSKQTAPPPALPPLPPTKPTVKQKSTPTPARIQNTYINTHSQETPPHTDALSKQNDTHMKLFDGVVRCSMAASFDSVSKFRREAHPLSGANFTCIHRKRGCEWLRKSIQDMVPWLGYSQQP